MVGARRPIIRFKEEILLKKEIIESNINEEVANGTMEILEQNLHSILVWDDENNQEIKFSFSELIGIF